MHSDSEGQQSAFVGPQGVRRERTQGGGIGQHRGLSTDVREDQRV